MNPKAYRLPADVLPRCYDLDLEAYLGSDHFRGSVAIRLDIREARESIELHSRDLRLSDVTLDHGGRIREGTADLDRDREIAILRFGEPLPTGEATLGISFSGEVNKGL